ncbi:hypothetical protein EDC01DRAFT_299140 [Geopyxis carbonaria]|nr:hypothetical protein EDC01DRAFT_299140 [Geopyxis carbonaria]
MQPHRIPSQQSFVAQHDSRHGAESPAAALDGRNEDSSIELAKVEPVLYPQVGPVAGVPIGQVPDLPVDAVSGLPLDPVTGLIIQDADILVRWRSNTLLEDQVSPLLKRQCEALEKSNKDCEESGDPRSGKWANYGMDLLIATCSAFVAGIAVSAVGHRVWGN